MLLYKVSQTYLGIKALQAGFRTCWEVLAVETFLAVCRGGSFAGWVLMGDRMKSDIAKSISTTKGNNSRPEAQRLGRRDNINTSSTLQGQLKSEFFRQDT